MKKPAHVNAQLPHRGAPADLALFAHRFLDARFAGFTKDIAICLTGIPAERRPGLTYAYFPALMACCGTLEYLACMYHGRKKCNDDQVAAYAAEFMPQPMYDPEAIRLLFEGFRHRVAHHGIASGVWHDERYDRRITWTIRPNRDPPAIHLDDDVRELISDPPWPCPVTHTAEIHLGCLAQDIKESALAPRGYAAALARSVDLLAKFNKCMRHMYPT